MFPKVKSTRFIESTDYTEKHNQGDFSTKDALRVLWDTKIV